MDNENKRIVEVNGIKMEIDLRHAKKIDVFRVGDPVKVLDMTYQSPQIRAGVIIGFAEFQSRPAIEVMMLKEDYNGPDFTFITISADSTTENGKDTSSKYEIVHYNSYEKLFTKSNVLTHWDKHIDKLKMQIEETERKKKYFLDQFQKSFEQIV